MAKFIFDSIFNIGDVVEFTETVANITPGMYRVNSVFPDFHNSTTPDNIGYFLENLETNKYECSIDQNTVIEKLKTNAIKIRFDISLVEYNVTYLNVDCGEISTSSVFVLPNTDVSYKYFEKRVNAGYHFDHEFGRDLAKCVPNKIDICKYEKV